MISMTAFGRAEASTRDVTVVVELRSVNHRFRDLKVRAPKEYSALEPRIVSVLKQHISRGRVDCTVRRAAQEGHQRVVPDMDLAESCFRALRDIAKRLGMPPESVRLEHVLTMPEVIASGDEDRDLSHEWDVLEPALTGAVDHLLNMRRTEGAAQKADLQKLLGEFSRHRESLLELMSDVQQQLYKRLHHRLDQLVGERVGRERLAQEAAILAEKADISEELARLASHVDQFREIFILTEPVGRRMEFLLQEMGREVNTLASKATPREASRLAVEMKTLLEKMREQAANVE